MRVRRPLQLRLAWLVLMISWGLFWSAAAPAESLRNVDLEWEQVEDATKYQIRIAPKSTEGSSPNSKTFKTNEPKWSGSLVPGLYTMELRSYDARGVPGEWSEPAEFWVKTPPPRPLSPAPNARERSNEDETYTTQFKWQAISGANLYRLEIESHDGAVKMTKEVTAPEVSVELPVARVYRWRVYGIMANQEPGEIPEAWQRLTLMGAPLERPNLQKPLTKYVQELAWEPTKHAAGYDYVLERRTAQGWKPVERKRGIKASPLVFDLGNPTGTYRAKLQAFAPLREKSKITEMEFEVRGGIRSPAALEEAQLRDSLERPSHIYYIASYLVTQIAYTGVDRESNAVASFSALGGTGRLGLGYQNDQSPWGTFGIVDLSGFDLGGQRYTFAAMEVDGTYKQYWGKAQILYGAGLFLKQLPDLRGSEATGFTGLGKIQNYGPSAGVQLWRPLSTRLGFQVHLRVYASMFGSAPNGQAVTTAISLQTGILGTYRLNSQMMGYAGYVYREDNSKYDANPFSDSHPESFADSGDVNSVKIGGHYLNLKLEYSY